MWNFITIKIRFKCAYVYYLGNIWPQKNNNSLKNIYIFICPINIQNIMKTLLIYDKYIWTNLICITLIFSGIIVITAVLHSHRLDYKNERDQY